MTHFSTHLNLGVQSWSPFVTRKGGHIWRIWAEMSQTPHAKINQNCPNSLARVQFRQNSPNFRQISAKFRQKSPNFRQNSPNFRQNSPNWSNFVSLKGSSFEHPTLLKTRRFSQELGEALRGSFCPFRVVNEAGKEGPFGGPPSRSLPPNGLSGSSNPQGRAPTLVPC